MGKRPGLFESIRMARRVVRARDVVLKSFEFTAPVPAQRVIDAVERRWGREVPTGAPGFYVASAIYQQQVIVSYGCDGLRLFAARIDFQPLESAAGTLWFYDAEHLATGTEAAEEFRWRFADLLAEVSPGAELREHDGSVLIMKGEPDPDWRARRGSHRKK